MGKINVARVILGGLLAGLVMNVSEYVLNTYVIAEESNAIIERFGLPPVGIQQIGVFVILTFILGIVMIFIYAGMRPRFGAGVKTALIAAVVVWLLVGFSSVIQTIIGIVPVSMLVLTGVWGIVEMGIAAVAGAWLYRESA
jgi:hypothetical protein